MDTMIYHPSGIAYVVTAKAADILYTYGFSKSPVKLKQKPIWCNEAQELLLIKKYKPAEIVSNVEEIKEEVIPEVKSKRGRKKVND